MTRHRPRHQRRACDCRSTGKGVMLAGGKHLGSQVWTVPCAEMLRKLSMTHVESHSTWFA
jgi:hypothetical protein